MIRDYAQNNAQIAYTVILVVVMIIPSIAAVERRLGPLSLTVASGHNLEGQTLQAIPVFPPDQPESIEIAPWHVLVRMSSRGCRCNILSPGRLRSGGRFRLW
jgi:hypothetical protein